MKVRSKIITYKNGKIDGPYKSIQMGYPPDPESPLYEYGNLEQKDNSSSKDFML